MENNINDTKIDGEAITKNNEKIEEQKDESYKDATEIKIEDINKLEDPIIIPSYTESEYENFENNLDTNELGNSDDDEMKLTTYLNLEGEDTRKRTNPDDFGKGRDKFIFTDTPVANNTSLALKQLHLKNRAKTKKSALLKLTQRVGLGGPIHVPLWHSGFWVTITPLTTEEIINLEFELIAELNRVGKITNTLIYSHYNVVFAEVIFKHFKSKILDTSLDLGEMEIEEFININDLYTIGLSLAMTMFPKGFNAIIPCKNTMVLNDKNVPSCNYKARVKLNLNEMLRVNTSLLNTDQINQMCKKTPKSVTVEDVIKYQEALDDIQTKSITYDIDGEPTVINLKSPNIKRYFESGAIFIEKLKDASTDLVMKNEQLDADSSENMLLEVFKLNTLTHFIDNIPTDEYVINDLETIGDALELFNTDTILVNKIIGDINDFKDNSLIAVVGVPTFKCPTCKALQSDNEIIPIPVYDYFFTLLHLKYTRVIKQITKQKQK